MAAPSDPNPMPGYRRSNRCPGCGAFANVSFGRMGMYRVTCNNCGLEESIPEHDLER